MQYLLDDCLDIKIKSDKVKKLEINIEEIKGSKMNW